MTKRHSRRLHPAAEATITTVLVGGSFHLILSFIAALSKHDIAYINPINFLGLSFLAPQLLESIPVTIALWALLVVAGFVILSLQRVIHIGILVTRRHRPKKITYSVGQEARAKKRFKWQLLNESLTLLSSKASTVRAKLVSDRGLE